MVQILLVGIGAGTAAALLFATLASGNAVSILLFYLTPLPILLAGIAYSQLAGLIAAVAAGALLGYALGRWFFLSFLVAIGVPAYVLSYLALLARSGPNGSGELEWFPAGSLVIAAAIMAAIATALTIPAFGFDLDSYRNTLREGFERILRAQTNTPAGQPLQLPGNRDPKQVLDLLALIMPPFAAMSMGTGLFNLWLAGRVARVSGRLKRPWPDLHELRFPNFTPLLFAVVIAATFISGITGLVASLFGVTLLLAYVLLGFAVIHHVTRNMGARLIILSSVWALLMFMAWPLLVVALIGLADPIFDFRKRFGGAVPPAPTPNA
jgi:hypothetical protein